MTAIDARLAALPGVVQPPERRGNTVHVALTRDGLVDAARLAIADLGGTLLSIAGEDHRSAGGNMHAHYVFGLAPTHDVLHLEVPIDRDATTVPTLASLSFPGSRFEREMRDLFGLTPVGHPDPRPLVRHGFWPETFHPLRRDALAPEFEDDGRAFPFTQVEGEGIYEIPVGPVHAGIIEPGHFRFSVLGETILKMRARLYFTHKGIEKLFENRAPDDGVALAERISGDTSVGHSVAFCQAVEAAAGLAIPDRARQLRVVLLELERLYNHIADVGAIIADTGFPVGQAHCLRLRESLLRLNKRVTGHRLLRGVTIPGGLQRDLPVDRAIVPELRRITDDFLEVADLCLKNTLVSDRLEGAGVLSSEVARDFGVVGYVARACGISDDARVDYPGAAYEHIAVTPVVERRGDVLARLRVRVGEVRQSVTVIEQALAQPATEGVRVEGQPLPPFQVAIGIVEGWRGRIVHLIVADERGHLRRVKVVDPSFFNWPALARALEDNIVPDFPLCNKSFNQSYSGNDL